MKTIQYKYWKDENFYIGYLNDYPDYHTQGLSKAELTDNLKELLKDIESREIPYIRKTRFIRLAFQHSGANNKSSIAFNKNIVRKKSDFFKKSDFSV